MQLLVQPGDGVLPLVKAMASAETSIEIVIFRFDQREIERALAAAVQRGVFVHALIAHTNRAGEDGLRALEMRLLAAGVTVARTADDLVRYHAKYLIIDRRDLYLLAFNFTHLDIEHSRSFGIMTRNRELVHEAVALFEADTRRHPYEPGHEDFVVSPANARQRLGKLIAGAKQELLIYDPKISDPAMIRLLEERARAGVSIRILGQLTRRIAGVSVHKLRQIRLHNRTIIRDREAAFIGSQSLRALELDERREAGMVFRSPAAVSQLAGIFEEDWRGAGEAEERARETGPAPVVKLAKRVAKAVTKELHPVAEVLDGAVRDLLGSTADVELDPKEVEAIVKDAVKAAVVDVVKDVMEEAVESGGKNGHGANPRPSQNGRKEEE